MLPSIKAKVTARKSHLLRELEGRLELCPDLRDALDAALVDDPPAGPRLAAMSAVRLSGRPRRRLISIPATTSFKASRKCGMPPPRSCTNRLAV